MSKILVTGADGFIGSHLVEELVRLGFDVKAFVVYNSMNSWGWLDHSSMTVRRNIEVVSGDIRDAGFVMESAAGCSKIIHLAALIAIPYSYIAPESYVATNIIGTLNVLNAAKKLGISRILHTSTSEVYGTAKFVPITELHPLQAQSPYSATKIGADQLVMSYCNSFETPAVIVRPFNTYGPRQSARAVIPTIISQILGGAEKIKLGSIYPTRDFNFIKDTVSGFTSILQSDVGVGEAINLGSNYEVSIGDTVKIIADVMNRKIEIETEDGRIRPNGSEVERLWADNTKANQLFNWSPRYAGLDGFKQGLVETVNWFSSMDNIANYKHGIYNV